MLRELHGTAMSMRMVPLKPLLLKARRLSRDLAERSGKALSFVGEGEGVEADRSLVSVLDEIMVHMVRNAVDHGIELCCERKARGKPETAVLSVRLAQERDGLVFEIRDDGRGLDRQKILKKALERGLISSSETPEDAECYGLIFKPGFSTADKVTDVSGRGVGMDVVKKLVETCGGKISIDTLSGSHCMFRITLPLTMAVSDGMLLRCAGHEFIVPVREIKGTLCIDGGSAVSIVKRRELVRYGGRMIPLFKLHDLLRLPYAPRTDGRRLALVLEDSFGTCAMEVDELLGQQPVVSKPIGGLEAAVGVAGGAILGNGAVSLVLDSGRLCSMARSAPLSC